MANPVGKKGLNKELFVNGISLRVETSIALLDEEHLINETVKFSPALFTDCLVYEMLFIEQCNPSLDTQTDPICENKRQQEPITAPDGR